MTASSRTACATAAVSRLRRLTGFKPSWTPIATVVSSGPITAAQDRDPWLLQTGPLVGLQAAEPLHLRERSALQVPPQYPSQAPPRSSPCHSRRRRTPSVISASSITARNIYYL